MCLDLIMTLLVLKCQASTHWFLLFIQFTDWCLVWKVPMHVYSVQYVVWTWIVFRLFCHCAKVVRKYCSQIVHDVDMVPSTPCILYAYVFVVKVLDSTLWYLYLGRGVMYMCRLHIPEIHSSHSWCVVTVFNYTCASVLHFFMDWLHACSWIHQMSILLNLRVHVCSPWIPRTNWISKICTRQSMDCLDLQLSIALSRYMYVMHSYVRMDN